MLSVEHVTKYYGDFLAVNDLSFEVQPGSVFGLLGINGAGKTTTFRIIMGLLDKNAGKVTMDGKTIDYNVTDKIGFLTEERSLLLRLTVKEQALLYGQLKGMTENEVLEKLDYYLKRFEIPEYKDKKIKELSKGNQQKIQFIISILHSPKLLILDEPFSGLDPINIELFKSVILEMKEQGTMIIFSSHRMDHVEYFCENLLILVNGNTVLQGKLSEIKKEYKKKNIKIRGNIDTNEVTKIKGVISVSKESDEYIVKIENDKYVNDVFDYVKKQENITKFDVEEPTLNEIFIEKVGEKYEK